MRDTTLRITEIFHSLQGETSRLGLPTVFVRLTGCPLRCNWCDSAYAFHGGRSMELAEVLAQVAQHGARHVCVTGGEPLAQRPVHALLTRLCDAGYSVSLETSGALSVAEVDPRVSRIVDIKAPGSGEADRNLWDNLALLNAHDEIKFVLADRADYDWACTVLRERNLAQVAPVLFSPVWESLPPAQLAQWVLADRLPVRMQVQLHKILWGEQPGV
ncbi:7-carboxy-7-deazaguanine synthase QueE [Chitiniphilus purpureus]|uniref:7-carboxy-7-deazaguanine synthase n=1 Tax=Chitiniphilus purpureus TaxID=2981137 RepID=A0ABY6DMP8_9NEIS|nr:7-carboxy-7-deazaguanine synthase QueE [Chitiniphilus sp. CD1]UXY15637.1 7-carboxy-7-deazaguanine synthase QueE [Chitiniphilus sp. CD1]